MNSAPVLVVGHKDAVVDVVRANQAHCVATCSDDSTIRIWNTATHKTLKCVGRNDLLQNMVSMKFHPRSNDMLFCLTEKNLLSVDISKEEMIISDVCDLLTAERDVEFTAMDINKNGSVIAVGDDNGLVLLFDIASKRITRRMHGGHDNLIGCLLFSSRSNKYLISGGFDARVVIWDHTRGRPSHVITHEATATDGNQVSNPPFIHGLVEVCEGRVVACAVGDGTVRLIGAFDGKPLYSIDAHSCIVSSIAVHCRDTYRFASMGLDGCIREWRITETSSGKNDTVLQCAASITINHGEKPNAITYSVTDDAECILCVADVSNSWYIYHLSG